VIIKLKLLLNDVVAHSLKAKEALQALELLEWTVLVVNAASVHDALAVEKFQIGRDKDSIFFEGSVTNVFAVLDIGDVTVNIVFFEQLTKFVEVAINNKAMSLPH